MHTTLCHPIREIVREAADNNRFTGLRRCKSHWGWQACPAYHVNPIAIAVGDARLAFLNLFSTASFIISLNRFLGFRLQWLISGIVFWHAFTQTYMLPLRSPRLAHVSCDPLFVCCGNFARWPQAGIRYVGAISFLGDKFNTLGEQLLQGRCGKFEQLLFF